MSITFYVRRYVPVRREISLDLLGDDGLAAVPLTELRLSILPVGLRGTSAKMILLGRLYRGRPVQNSSISSPVQAMPGLI
jgi:hypothetical protein